MMRISFHIDSPSGFSLTQKEDFLAQLKEQAQTKHPTLEKVQACFVLCMVFWDETLVAISALKPLNKEVFKKAGRDDLVEEYELELGYFFVHPSYRGWGLGKMMARLLLQEANAKKIYSTTEISEQNSAFRLLKSLHFKQIGKSYIGHQTGKTVGLFIA